MFRPDATRRWPGVLLIPCLLLVGPGCATVMRGTSQAVRVKTKPEGATAVFEGRPIRDGDLVVIQKKANAPFIEDDRGVREYLTFEPDPWLIGDALLLIPFVFPGVIALAVDGMTGSWRNFHETQTVHLVTVPASAPASDEGLIPNLPGSGMEPGSAPGR